MFAKRKFSGLSDTAEEVSVEGSGRTATREEDERKSTAAYRPLRSRPRGLCKPVILTNAPGVGAVAEGMAAEGVEGVPGIAEDGSYPFRRGVTVGRTERCFLLRRKLSGCRLRARVWLDQVG